MMKKTKKLVSLMLSLFLLLGVTPFTAFAADAGSITITNATKEETYTAYRIFDAKVSTDGEGITYTATEAQKAFYEGKTNNPFVFATNGNVSIADGKTDADVITFLQSFVTKPEGGTVTVDPGFAAVTDALPSQKATSETVTFDNVPYGYYLVSSSLGAVVTVDSNNKDVTVIDKNQGPQWPDDGPGKTITGGTINDSGESVDSVNLGDKVKFGIKVKASNYDGAKKVLEYKIKDIMAKGLEYNQSELIVKVGTKTLVAGTDYTVEWNTTDNSFEIKIPWITNEGQPTQEFLYESPVDITVTYTATVTDEALIAGAGNENKATFSYRTDKPEPGKPWEESTTTTAKTYVFALGINKTDGEGKPLAGAKFKLTLDGVDVKVKPIDGKLGVYEYDTTGSNVVETPTSGVVVIRGVKEGTYTLTEIEAPEGYNMLTAPVSVEATIVKSTEYKTTTTVYYDANGNVTEEETETKVEVVTEVPVSLITIVNKVGSSLPSTGGIGTTIFYVLGGILVAGTAVIFINKKRMKSTK